MSIDWSELSPLPFYPCLDDLAVGVLPPLTPPLSPVTPVLTPQKKRRRKEMNSKAPLKKAPFSLSGKPKNVPLRANAICKGTYDFETQSVFQQLVSSLKDTARSLEVATETIKLIARNLSLESKVHGVSELQVNKESEKTSRLLFPQSVPVEVCGKSQKRRVVIRPFERAKYYSNTSNHVGTGNP